MLLKSLGSVLPGSISAGAILLSYFRSRSKKPKPRLSLPEIRRKRRIALYSPGMVGLGHMRRNLLIAQRLAHANPGAAILLISEAREASNFSLPTGVDCLTLPALIKHNNGQLQTRYLDLPLEEVVSSLAAISTGALPPGTMSVWSACTVLLALRRLGV